ncbi:MAG: AAA family ATPase, partial [Methylosarcina sp.]
PKRLIVVPLPDAGGNVSLFEIDPVTKAPATTQAFRNLTNQLKAMANLTLVVLDPLQALCGGLDLNLPQHGQHVCGALAKLAADTGAAAIGSHHFRKGNEIKNPEDAREAIRGSGGLVDGVRSAIALWPASSTEVEQTCKRLGLEWQRNRVCKMAVVKANFKADWHIKTLVRGEDGLLSDRGLDLYNATPKPAETEAKLLEEIEQAAGNGTPFTKTGQSGIYERRHELSAFFHDWGRNKLQDAVQGLLNAGKLRTFKLKGTGKNGAVWLGKPDGVLSVSQSVAEGGCRKRTGLVINGYRSQRSRWES